MADLLGEAAEARTLLETAFQQAAEAEDVALLLEHQLCTEGDREAALALIAQRAELVRDPVLATLLRIEVARAKEDAGDADGALSVLRSAVTTPAARWRVLEQLERVARRAGRHPERIVALEGRAKLAAAEARGEDQGQASGAFSVQRFTDQARAAAEASALYREAARQRLARLNDAAGARRDYDAALELRPEDPLLRYERMVACELAGDLEAAAADAQRLLDAGIEGPAAAALRFRLAERAVSQGDGDEALAQMRTALADDPGSAALAAMLDDLLRATGDTSGALALVVQRAEAGEGPARAQRYWEAAQLAADALSDFAAARGFFESAAAAAEDATPILREMYGAALRLGDAGGARAAAGALLERELEGEERSAVFRDLHELLRMVLEDEDAADSLLERALKDPAASAWAADLARLHGALRDRPALAAAAHLALAERAGDAETAAAHLCAAARMQVRAGKSEEAVQTLRAALARSPSHPYAVALLEEVLRARGDADELVRLLKGGGGGLGRAARGGGAPAPRGRGGRGGRRGRQGRADLRGGGRARPHLARARAGHQAPRGEPQGPRAAPARPRDAERERDRERRARPAHAGARRALRSRQRQARARRGSPAHRARRGGGGPARRGRSRAPPQRERRGAPRGARPGAREGERRDARALAARARRRSARRRARGGRRAPARAARAERARPLGPARRDAPDRRRPRALRGAARAVAGARARDRRSGRGGGAPAAWPAREHARQGRGGHRRRRHPRARGHGGGAGFARGGRRAARDALGRRRPGRTGRRARELAGSRRRGGPPRGGVGPRARPRRGRALARGARGAPARGRRRGRRPRELGRPSASARATARRGSRSSRPAIGSRTSSTIRSSRRSSSRSRPRRSWTSCTRTIAPSAACAACSPSTRGGPSRTAGCTTCSRIAATTPACSSW
ncbi:MAG: hypothetical protein M5U28_10625 [Sandaracinaceae bacterium]|nr:hypothetical protein [Sandaracinaceae bacterium]